MSDNEKISDEKKEGREKIEKKRGWQSLRGTDNDSGEQPHVSVRPTSRIVTPPNVPTMIEASSKLIDENLKQNDIYKADEDEKAKVSSQRISIPRLEKMEDSKQSIYLEENDKDSHSTSPMTQVNTQNTVTTAISNAELLQPRQSIIKRKASYGAPLPGAYRAPGLSDTLHSNNSTSEFSHPIENSAQDQYDMTKEKIVSDSSPQEKKEISQIDCIVMVKEAQDAHAESKSMITNHKFWIVISILIILFVSIGVGVYMAIRNAQSNPSVSCSMDEIVEACAKDYSHQVQIPECIEDLYRSLIKELTTDFPLAVSPPLETSCSSENLAMLSLSFQSKTTMSSSTKLTRYGLSLLYFATGGWGWKNREGWMTEESHCDWSKDNIYCSNDDGEAVTDIVLVNNNLIGILPSNLLTFLPDLTYFDASMNDLTGSIPSDFAKLTALRLSDNSLNGTIPISFIESTSLEILALSNNDNVVIDNTLQLFRGDQWKVLLLNRVIHASSRLDEYDFSSLPNLQDLDVSTTSLNGTLPSEIGLMTKLTSLELSGNLLVGSLPSEIGKLTDLSALLLDSNKISGSIPTEFGSLNGLFSLYLNDNRIKGTIPSQMGNLGNLMYLALGENKLTGQLPKEFVNLKNLTELGLYLNQFDGTLPTEICALRKDGELNFIPESLICVDNIGGLQCPETDSSCCCP
jgi:Leucine-rich repeat (LRR) protein